MFKQKICFTNIVAVSNNGVIGVDNSLPWRLKSELRQFAHTIKDFKLLMGRKTCESLPRKQNNQENFVLTSDKNFSKEGYTTIGSLYDLQNYLKPGETVYVIGGGTLYNQILDLDDETNVVVNNEVTLVNLQIYGDNVVKFPIERLDEEYSKVFLTRGKDDDTDWIKYLYYKN